MTLVRNLLGLPAADPYVDPSVDLQGLQIRGFEKLAEKMGDMTLDGHDLAGKLLSLDFWWPIWDHFASSSSRRGRPSTAGSTSAGRGACGSGDEPTTPTPEEIALAENKTFTTVRQVMLITQHYVGGKTSQEIGVHGSPQMGEMQKSSRNESCKKILIPHYIVQQVQ